MSINDFKCYPAIAEYFGEGCKTMDDSPITVDIESLQMVLPAVMRASDSEEELVEVGRTISYVIGNLTGIRKNLINGREA